MARPIKNDLPYFSHDNDMRNHPKIKAIRARFGHLGYAIFNMLLEYISQRDLIRVPWDELTIDLLAGDFDIKPDEMQAILDYMMRPGMKLFKIENCFLMCDELDIRSKSCFIKRNRGLVNDLRKVSDSETPLNGSVSGSVSTQIKENNTLVKQPGNAAGLNGSTVLFSVDDSAGKAIKISASFFGKILKACNDRYSTMECFYKSIGKRDPKAYIVAGVADKSIFNTRVADEDGRAKAAWIEKIEASMPVIENDFSNIKTILNNAAKNGVNA